MTGTEQPAQILLQITVNFERVANITVDSDSVTPNNKNGSEEHSQEGRKISYDKISQIRVLIQAKKFP